MPRSIAGFLDGQVKSYGAGFGGWSSSGVAGDYSIRYDLDNHYLKTSSLYWGPIGSLGVFGWNLIVTENLGNYTYSESGEVAAISIDRMTVKNLWV